MKFSLEGIRKGFSEGFSNAAEKMKAGRDACGRAYTSLKENNNSERVKVLVGLASAIAACYSLKTAFSLNRTPVSSLAKMVASGTVAFTAFEMAKSDMMSSTSFTLTQRLTESFFSKTTIAKLFFKLIS